MNGNQVIVDELALTSSEPVTAVGEESILSLGEPVTPLTDKTLTIGEVTGAAGGKITVPIEINNSSGLNSVGLTIKYDTTLLDVVDPNGDTDTNEAIKRVGISQDWKLVSDSNPNEEFVNPVANVDDATGEIKIALINPGEVTTDTTGGNILEIDFTINPAADLNAVANIDLVQAELGVNGEPVNLGDTLLKDGTITVGAGVSLDVDGDGKIGALTDGLMVFGYLTLKDIPVEGIFSQLDSLIQPGATRTDGAQVASYLESVSDSLLDVDGDGKIGALTDGLMVFGYLTLKDIPVEGIFSQLDSLIQPGATRTDGAQVAGFLEQFVIENV
jgi:hypothetical protein